jgi:SH3-like domain-containing protein
MKHKTLLGIFVLFLFALPAFAVDETDNSEGGASKNGSGLPIPRFASLRASDVNLRTGPGIRYPIEWVFTHQGMPVEITAEYEMWRKVRDVEGDEGWVHRNALSGKRYAIVTGTMHELRDDNNDRAGIVAHLQAGAIGQLLSCSKDWCKLKFKGGIKGYLHKTDFWGAYDAETFG